MRTSTRAGRLAPIRVTSPYSIARRSRSWAGLESVASSSRNRVPPLASSKRPGLALVAPVKAPASWPNSSASIKVSGSAAQFMIMSGPSQREERWWRRSAISSFPVPRSPMTSTGRSSGAARLARSTASRKEEDWPTSWVLRSIETSCEAAWDKQPFRPLIGIFHHLLASKKRLIDLRNGQLLADLRHFLDLAHSLLSLMCSVEWVGGMGMKTRFRETEMFSFDHLAKVATAAVGALILSTLSIAAAVGPAERA